MRKPLLSLTAQVSLIGLWVLIGCEPQPFPSENDFEPPAVPRGVTSTTGDRQVLLSWYPNGERDLAGYHVYRSNSERGNYHHIAATRSTTFVDHDVLNGRTYYYAVSAYDFAGNESDLSDELIFDTPRPAGYGVRLFDFAYLPQSAGYDFSNYKVQDYRDNNTDIFFEYHEHSGGMLMNVANQDTDIQDFGYTESLDDVDYAPSKGWSPRGSVECIVGHSYVIWTADNHFAKIRVVTVNPDFVEFDWAYQIAMGNPELLVHTAKPGKIVLLHKFGE
ncbi:MAG: hypothetical protein ONB44_19060 [candidate division KSB1 bacterium]|nr:hypothetical protein [candidate division KSB1 bacterium]MDZ7304229.1 hypothetical protein [candidate division KSB1 bacterium]MDZ7311704.1 hypothetical protein [candidate division KSB1 bacterium]